MTNDRALQTLNSVWMNLENQRLDLINRIGVTPEHSQYFCGYLECIKYIQRQISAQYDKQKAA